MKADTTHFTVKTRVQTWWHNDGLSQDWTDRADVYYAEQTMHDYLERTTWHAGQHTRQLMWAMADRLRIIPEHPLSSDTFGGLPMPESIWDPT